MRDRRRPAGRPIGKLCTAQGPEQGDRGLITWAEGRMPHVLFLLGGGGGAGCEASLLYVTPHR